MVDQVEAHKGTRSCSRKTFFKRINRYSFPLRITQTVFETFAQETLSKMAAALGKTSPEVKIMPAHDSQHA